jgi:hypothetical protein
MLDLDAVKERLLRKRITELASPKYPATLEASANDVPALIAEVEELRMRLNDIEDNTY